MRLAEIIDEIDRYVLRLQHARDLLVGSTMAEQRSPASSRQMATNARRRVRATRNALEFPEKKLAAGITTRKPKPAAENIFGSHGGVSVTVEAAERNEPALSAPESASHQVERTLSVQKGNTRATPQGRRPVRQKKAPTKLETSPMPAATSSKPVPTGWVVVSAKEAKRQREAGKNLAQLRSATPSRGLTGRRAFEALFGDTSESSSSSPSVKR